VYTPCIHPYTPGYTPVHTLGPSMTYNRGARSSGKRVLPPWERPSVRDGGLSLIFYR